METMVKVATRNMITPIATWEMYSYTMKDIPNANPDHVCKFENAAVASSPGKKSTRAALFVVSNTARPAPRRMYINTIPYLSPLNWFGVAEKAMIPTTKKIEPPIQSPILFPDGVLPKMLSGYDPNTAVTGTRAVIQPTVLTPRPSATISAFIYWSANVSDTPNRILKVDM
mmetsp:Transcript_8840/g.14342  ORF Transcript_8840/g.14342 Transcript_8840/m.14342 type:complete len:171 (+) Transcript_8840:342-854(+)